MGLMRKGETHKTSMRHARPCQMLSLMFPHTFLKKGSIVPRSMPRAGHFAAGHPGNMGIGWLGHRCCRDTQQNGAPAGTTRGEHAPGHQAQMGNSDPTRRATAAHGFRSRASNEAGKSSETTSHGPPNFPRDSPSTGFEAESTRSNHGRQPKPAM